MSNGFGPVGRVPIDDPDHRDDDYGIGVSVWWTSSDHGGILYPPEPPGLDLTNEATRTLAALLLSTAVDEDQEFEITAATETGSTVRLTGTLTHRRFKVDDAVTVPDSDLGGTVVGFPADDDERARDHDWLDRLYLVNVGNVFDEMYEAVYAEKELVPYEPRDELVSHGYPLTDEQAKVIENLF